MSKEISSYKLMSEKNKKNFYKFQLSYA